MRPSKLLKLKKRLRHEGVFDPEFICYCFDKAVVWTGHYVENHANSHDAKEHGDFNAYFDRLFEDQPAGKDGDVIAKLSQMFGVIRR